MTQPVLIVVEGRTDVPYAQAIVAEAGRRPGATIVKRGHGGIDRDLGRWNQPGNHRPMLVLRDLDPMPAHAGCPPSVLRTLCGGDVVAPGLAVRLVERELESWILADGDALVDFFDLRTPPPAEPDLLPDPKRTLAELCGRSRTGAVRRGMAARASSGRAVGPEFEDRVIAFAEEWSPSRAATRSPSLARTLARARDLAASGLW